MTVIERPRPIVASDDVVGSRLRVLGEFELTVAGGAPAFGRSGMELIQLLAVTPERSRGRLQAALWPDADVAVASGRLRSLLYRIKRQSGEEIIRPVGGHALCLAPSLDVDYSRAAALVRAIGRSGRPLKIVGTEVVEILARDLLPFESHEWLAPYQWSWSHTRLATLATFARACADAGDWANATRAGEVIIFAEPFHEQIHYLLIGGLLREGFVVSARALYESLRERLARELACQPRRSYGELLHASRQPLA